MVNQRFLVKFNMSNLLQSSALLSNRLRNKQNILSLFLSHASKVFKDLYSYLYYAFDIVTTQK